MHAISTLLDDHNLEMPGDFCFRYAEAALSVGVLDIAIEYANRYLVVAGREGAFYRRALELLDTVDQIRNSSLAQIPYGNSAGGI